MRSIIALPYSVNLCPCPAGAAWQPNLVDHGWYFSVEPFTGMTIHGHKVRWRAIDCGGTHQLKPLPSANRVYPESHFFPCPQGYQFNHLVQRTDELYPNLWVAPGSAASTLGQAMGMDADFVTGREFSCLECACVDSDLSTILTCVRRMCAFRHSNWGMWQEEWLAL